MNIDLRTLLDWSQPEQDGGRLVRTARPTVEFWPVWNANKATLAAKGISCAKSTDGWVITWRQSPMTRTEVKPVSAGTAKPKSWAVNTFHRRVSAQDYEALKARADSGTVILFSVTHINAGQFQVLYKENHKQP